jgi:hypothetical protein
MIGRDTEIKDVEAEDAEIREAAVVDAIEAVVEAEGVE